MLVIVALAALGGCVELPPRPELPDQLAIAPAEGGAVDNLVAGVEALHPGESAFRLVTEGTEAFVVRMQSARLAARSQHTTARTRATRLATTAAQGGATPTASPR